jgi:hypothetical protein
MKNTIIFITIFFTCLSSTGCGQRILGNPSTYSYEQYSDYRNYGERQLRETEKEMKEQNLQSTRPNPPLPGESTKDFNKACRKGVRP